VTSLKRGFGGFEVFVEEVVHELVYFGVPEAVTAAFYGVESGLDFRFLEGVVENFALVVGDEGVFVAVADQEGGIVFGDVCGGIGGAALVLVLLDGAADESGFGGVGGVVVHC